MRLIKNMDIIEGMDYYWQATSEKEKVGEQYIVNMAEMDGMKLIYDDEFTSESVRKVLSAISNREMMTGNKKTMRFWNNNMWMLEDLEYTKMMIAPLKTLNIDAIAKKLDITNCKYEDIEIIFVPGHLDEYYLVDNKLIINFFRVKPDLYEDDKVTIDDKLIQDYICEKLIELCNG
ncbi:hypothetical protein PV797_10215 [Clostridiaceae bacterium M8S5]|nr:hypothetical protein PV797_10215 [Clostridiaceae bacterium M8S5]